MGIVWRILAVVYGCVVALRGWLYDVGVLKSYRSRIPVISVGNVTAGGNGKTPLCIAIALELQGRGYTPAILSRGYGGSLRGPHRVTGLDSCRDVGDEAVVMAQSGVPVFVARRRVEGVKLIEEDPAIDVVILDDGFQHRALERILDIVSVFVGTPQAVEEFAAGRLLPAGMFREARDAALKRAHMIVLSSRAVEGAARSAELPESVLKLLPPSAAIYRSFLSASSVVSLEGNRTFSRGDICALAAIANPEGFFRSLEVLGFKIVERFAFRDHYIFDEREIIGVLAKHPQMLFVCTEKDAVKLRELSPAIGERFAVLSVTAQLSPSDAFFVRVERAIQAHHAAEPRSKVARL
jgi:tetraacyldisaccharide 4'-kinase